MTRARRLCLPVLIAVAAYVGALPVARAQQASEREYEIKAAFLYNFIKFIDWPTDILPATTDTLAVCVLSDDPFGEALEPLRDKVVKGRRLAIRRVEPKQALGLCHVLFVGSAEEKRLPQLMQNLQGASVLTIGEMERFAQAGGIINFVVERNRIRFDINVASAERARLKLSSQLLSLARLVRQ